MTYEFYSKEECYISFYFPFETHANIPKLTSYPKQTLNILENQRFKLRQN